jgi:hypothetical protein
MHLVVPRYLDVEAVHAIDEDVSEAVDRALEGPTEVIVHFDPCRPRQCPACEKPDCPVRSAPFRRRYPWSLQRATRTDEELETGEPLPVGPG